MHILSGIDLPADMVCGSLILAADLYSTLRRSDDTVTFVCLAGRSGDPLVADAVALPVVKRAHDDPEYLATLTRHIVPLEPRPDLLHVHHLAYGMSQTLLSLYPGVPSIGFAHGTDIYDAKRDPDVGALVCDIAQRCTLLVFPSVSLVREALDAGITLPVAKICVVPWGVPLPAPRGGSDEAATTSTYRVLAAGRFTDNKDFVTAIRALAHLPEAYQLTIFGEGREDEAIRAEIRRLGLQDRVDLRPMAERRMLWAQMRRADCAVFPTKETEAFGMFGVECQANGVPLIVSSIPVFGEVFGPSAVTFATADPTSLAAALRQVCESSRLRRLLRLCGLANARKYDLAVRVAEIARLGHSLVGRPVRPRLGPTVGSRS